MKKPKVCILRTAGTNCDKETAFAFVKAGAEAEFVHINSLINEQKKLDDFHILALPGGFTYGDDVAAGKILANELKYKLREALRKFIVQEKLIIGICNGFQILVKSGLLPFSAELSTKASLIINDSGKFEARWVYLKTQDTRHKTQVNCVWAKNLPKIIYLPIAHGEGKFVVKDKKVFEQLKNNGQIVFSYAKEDGAGPKGYPDNPNGSLADIAGICDETGRILGLMPHPERHIDPVQHPRYHLCKNKKECPSRRRLAEAGDGLAIFRNGVEYARRHL